MGVLLGPLYFVFNFTYPQGIRQAIKFYGCLLLLKITENNQVPNRSFRQLCRLVLLENVPVYRAFFSSRPTGRGVPLTGEQAGRGILSEAIYLILKSLFAHNCSHVRHRHIYLII